MPANLSPEFKAAEAAFRATREPRARLDALREMLRTIPKHKGTEHLQADIKARIKALGDQLEGGGHKAGGHGGPALVVRPEGAAQVVLLGPPNAGKSQLHLRLTGSHAQVAPYPFTTQFPEPGMLPFEDIQFQLVDLPAVAPEHPLPWLGTTLQAADAALLVVDLREPAVVEQVDVLRSMLAKLRVTLLGAGESAASDDPFAIALPTLMLANKAEGLADPQAELQALGEMAGGMACGMAGEAGGEIGVFGLPAIAVSAETGLGLDRIAPWLFERLEVVRVYTKVPGHAAERSRPFTLRRGQTVADVARLVHRDLVRTLRYARLWGPSGFDGQQVGPEHPVADGDVVELHT